MLYYSVEIKNICSLLCIRTFLKCDASGVAPVVAPEHLHMNWALGHEDIFLALVVPRQKKNSSRYCALFVSKANLSLP